PPATFQSWLFGVLNGGQDNWIMRYMESEFFERARKQVKSRTGGLDIQMVMMGCAALNAARVRIPAVLNAALNQIKAQATSSIVISGADSTLYTGLLKLASEKSKESHSSMLQFRGQHHALSLTGELNPLPGKTQGSFWHDGTRFTLEVETPPKAKNVLKPEDAISGALPDSFVDNPDLTRNMTVRCFGHSQDPILALLQHVKKRMAQNTKLHIRELGAYGMRKFTSRNKRPLSTVDLDPLMMQNIIDDVELFFHKDSQTWYENSGRPYRFGMLLTGPPGTGKSSLVAGIASHLDIPLCLISLQDMSDNDLKEAFSEVPFGSCVALEDIDCVGLDIGNRGAQKRNRKSGSNTQSSGRAVTSDNAQTLAIEAMMTQFMERQADANHRVLEQAKSLKEATVKAFTYDDDDEDDQLKDKKPNPPSDSNESSRKKSVTLSGLLNVIDGVNASEGRLLILTTNHPEKLDPALYRAGRIERIFEISYASKASSIKTFKRLFDNDICQRYTSEAIDRFAQAFQAQFPSKSRITTAELAKYCSQYRGRPDKAVLEFADWLKVGADKFTCPVDYTKVVDEPGTYNIPEPFDHALLSVSASDLVNPDAAAASGIAAPEAQAVVSQPWNPVKALGNVFVHVGEYTDLDSMQDTFHGADTNTAGLNALVGQPQPSVDGRHAQIIEQCIRLGLTKPGLSSSSAQADETTIEFDDADFDDVPEFRLRDRTPPFASATSSAESVSDENHHHRASPMRSFASVQFSEPGKLTPVSPRPLDDCD
ncbi:P-loop containing nucleoside triphosphate hydrolase protein, partial [Decorospora gaudefroyi]